jgi:hypothetical protein
MEEHLMNIKTLKGISTPVMLILVLLVIILLVIWIRGCRNEPAPPDSVSTGEQELKPEETVKDTFTLTCPVGAASARANVEDLTNTGNSQALMRVMLFKDGNAVQQEDLPRPIQDQPPYETGERLSLRVDQGAVQTEGSNSIYDRPSENSDGPSPDAVLEKGSGTYLMIFFKTGEGEKTYRGSAVCQTAAGNPLPTLLDRIQNQ